MGIRYRKSISLGGGVRMNLSKSGVGYSVGIPGLRYSVSPNGRRRTTRSIPGTGISSVSTSSSHVRTSAHGSSRGAAVAQPVDIRRVLPRPGWLAGATDKRYYEGIQSYLTGEHPAAFAAFEACLVGDPSIVSAHFFAAVAGEKGGASKAQRIAHLEAVVSSDVALPDKLQQKYLPDGLVAISVRSSITDHIAADVPFTSAGATIALAEAYQEIDRIPEAIGLIAQLHEASPLDPVVRLSLADLLYADGDYEGVLEASSGASNDSDIGIGMLHLRAAALFASNHRDGAFEAFRLALAKTAGRDPELLKVVRYDRALAYDAAGQATKARADLEKIYGVDPSFEDVRERLAAT